MFWWYWEHLERQRITVEALCPGLFGVVNETPSPWQWVMIFFLDAPLVAYVLTNVLALNPKTRSVFTAMLVVALYVNTLLLYLFSVIVPGIQADNTRCVHRVDDRPCEEAAILVMIMTFTAIYDAKRVHALHLSQTGLTLRWVCLGTVGALGATAQSQLQLFEPLEVLAGAALGTMTAVMVNVFVHVIMIPILEEPPSKRPHWLVRLFRYAGVPLDRI